MGKKGDKMKLWDGDGRCVYEGSERHRAIGVAGDGERNAFVLGCTTGEV